MKGTVANATPQADVAMMSLSRRRQSAGPKLAPPPVMCMEFNKIALISPLEYVTARGRSCTACQSSDERQLVRSFRLSSSGLSRSQKHHAPSNPPFSWFLPSTRSLSLLPHPDSSPGQQ